VRLRVHCASPRQAGNALLCVSSSLHEEWMEWATVSEAPQRMHRRSVGFEEQLKRRWRSFCGPMDLPTDTVRWAFVATTFALHCHARRPVSTPLLCGVRVSVGSQMVSARRALKKDLAVVKRELWEVQTVLRDVVASAEGTAPPHPAVAALQDRVARAEFAVRQACSVDILSMRERCA
jgi:hypothetical protein